MKITLTEIRKVLKKNHAHLDLCVNNFYTLWDGSGYSESIKKEDLFFYFDCWNDLNKEHKKGGFFNYLKEVLK